MPRGMGGFVPFGVYALGGVGGFYPGPCGGEGAGLPLGGLGAGLPLWGSGGFCLPDQTTRDLLGYIYPRLDRLQMAQGYKGYAMADFKIVRMGSKCWIKQGNLYLMDDGDFGPNPELAQVFTEDEAKAALKIIQQSAPAPAPAQDDEPDLAQSLSQLRVNKGIKSTKRKPQNVAKKDPAKTTRLIIMGVSAGFFLIGLVLAIASQLADYKPFEYNPLKDFAVFFFQIGGVFLLLVLAIWGLIIIRSGMGDKK